VDVEGGRVAIQAPSVGFADARTELLATTAEALARALLGAVGFIRRDDD